MTSPLLYFTVPPGSSESAKELSSSSANDLITISGRITYDELIDLRSDSDATVTSDKSSSILVNIRDPSGQPMMLSSKGIMDGRVSTNIIPSLSEIQGKSFIFQTSNSDKFEVYATDPEAIQLLTDNY